MLAFACKGTKKSQKSTGLDSYRVIVSFISKGEGPDAKTKASLESYVLSFGKKEGKTIAYDMYHWGKEGEMDYCFYLKELNKGKQEAFVKGLKNLTKASSLVFINENTPCSHKK
jgi:hypothetical protein